MRKAVRRVMYGGANTLDNYIARTDDSFDWILHSPEANEFLKKMWESLDTIVMGRRTYEVATRMGHGVGHTGITTYVCSRTLTEVAGKNTELATDAVSLVKRLKTEQGKNIAVMGGGMLAKSLFEAGLIDEVGVNIHPLLLGSGIPLFCAMDRQVKLELLDCKSLKNGCVLLTYRVLP